MADRALGNPLGNPLGLPRPSGETSDINPVVVYFDSGSGEFVVDKNLYKFFRITAVGAGGGGRGQTATSSVIASGGGGGGLAITDITPVQNSFSVLYSVGSGGSAGTDSVPGGDGGDSSVEFLGRILIGKGGKGGVSQSAHGAGGQGIGGDKNYSGANGRTTINSQFAGGGGAAGIDANGDELPDGVNTGGGSARSNSASGGGGAGAPSLSQYSAPIIVNPKYIANRGTPAEIGSPGFAPSSGTGGDGGFGGGGGGGYAGSGGRGGVGGNGCVRIELW